MSTVTSTGTIRLLSLAAVLALSAVAAGQQRQVTGTVVDADGAPVAGADVASYWSFGEKPQASNGGTSDDDGSFTVDVRFGGRPTALMAMNAERTAGGLVVLDKATVDEPARIELGPLVHLHGSITSTSLGERPEWTNVYMSIGRSRVGSCTSNDATFSFALPPGEWDFWAYGTDVRDHREQVTLAKEKLDHDLGVLDIEATIIAKHYGKAPPKWRVADARGVPKDVQLAAFEGKWVLMEFWGFW